MQRNSTLTRKVGLRSKTPLKGSPLQRTRTLKQKSSSAKKKQRSTSILKKRLWAIFTQYIKARDKGICFTCDAKAEGQNYQGGHFIPKAAGGLALYFNEDNVHGQCGKCNLFLEGNHYEYGIRLGKEKVAELYALKNANWKWSAQDYLDKIALYKEKLHELSGTN